MRLSVTSRHFRAHKTLLNYAKHEAEKLKRYYDGIITCNIILKYEKSRNSDKIAEVVTSVYNAQLTGVARSADFFKSIDAAIKKVTVQLKKYKSKLRDKDKKTVRRIREKAV